MLIGWAFGVYWSLLYIPITTYIGGTKNNVTQGQYPSHIHPGGYKPTCSDRIEENYSDSI